MSYNKGKQFEIHFREDFKKSFPKSFCFRLPDQMSGYLNSSNPCDFIGFTEKTLFLLELKSIKGNTLPFTNITQFGKLVGEYNKKVDNEIIGVIAWFYDHDKVVFIDIKELLKMYKEGKKSVNIKYLDTKEYNILEIPSIRKRTYMVSDYTVLLNREDK